MEKKNVHKIGPLAEGKKNIISGLFEDQDIESAQDIQEALNDLLGGTIKSMMESGMDSHLGYKKSERNLNSNYRNGNKSKHVRSSMGSLTLMFLRIEIVNLSLRLSKKGKRI